jgi:hypothetical protein
MCEKFELTAANTSRADVTDRVRRNEGSDLRVDARRFARPWATDAQRHVRTKFRSLLHIKWLVRIRIPNPSSKMRGSGRVRKPGRFREVAGVGG